MFAVHTITAICLACLLVQPVLLLALPRFSPIDYQLLVLAYQRTSASCCYLPCSGCRCDLRHGSASVPRCKPRAPADICHPRHPHPAGVDALRALRTCARRLFDCCNVLCAGLQCLRSSLLLLLRGDSADCCAFAIACMCLLLQRSFAESDLITTTHSWILARFC